MRNSSPAARWSILSTAIVASGRCVLLWRRPTTNRIRASVELESFLRKASTSGDGEVRQLPWLPGKSRVTEHAPREEASQVAHDVFASWVRKVRHSIPPEPLKSSA